LLLEEWRKYVVFSCRSLLCFILGIFLSMVVLKDNVLLLLKL